MNHIHPESNDTPETEREEIRKLSPKMPIPEAVEAWDFTDPETFAEYIGIKEWEMKDKHGYTVKILEEIREAEETLQQTLN